MENPGTGEIEGELLQASDADLDHAIEVARRAQKEWAKVSLAKRTAIMFRMRQLVLDLLLWIGTKIIQIVINSENILLV